jgi:hypothetical protein
MPESKEEHEKAAIKKTLTQFYYTEISRKYDLQIESKVNRHNEEMVTISSTKNDSESLKDLIKKLVIDLAETKTDLWTVKNFKNQG